MKFNKGKIDFIGKAKMVLPITFIILAVGAFEIAYEGFDYGIDFAGGTEIQVQFDGSVDRQALESTITGLGYDKMTLQEFGEDNEWLIRLETIKANSDKESNEKLNAMIKGVTEGINANFASVNPNIRRVDSVGPQVGDELKRNGLLAGFYSLLMILVYIGLRFDYKYAPGAVFCLFHDVIITLSIFAIFDREVNVQTMAAILTLIGYSLNDTIITFDRIRENERLFRDQNFSDVVNRSINDMLTRTVLTTLTTLVACSTLFYFADGTIRDIAFTLGIGIIIGTYSSIYVASMLVIVMDRYERRREETRLKTARA